MRRFWIVFSIVLGILTVLTVIGVIGWGIFGDWSDIRPSGSDSMVLKLDFSRGVPEVHSNDPFARFTSRGMLTLLEVDRALTHAADDPRVRGLVLDLTSVQMGSAQMEEIRDGILRFRQSGKWAIAYADTFFTGGTGTGLYYLASACDEIYMHRAGDVGFMGMAIQPLFFAEALEKLGVQPVMGQRYEYKTMINMWTETDYTEPQREIEQRLLNGLLAHIVDGVADARGIPADRLRALIDSAPFIGREALDAGLVDGFRYWDEVKTRIEERVGEVPDMVRLHQYYQDSVPDLRQSRENIIAVVYGVGEVVRGEAVAGL
ncbi:MAG TPA: S49 family peptidase, partial [bacterium]|nr:S49 family peptidase [bacterium]